jgi:hypothetical protein
MIPQIDLARHTAIRSRIRATVEVLKTEGVTTSELIECVGNELHSLKKEAEREFEAAAKSIDHAPAAGSLPKLDQNRR